MKKQLNLSVDDELKTKIKQAVPNISEFFEIACEDFLQGDRPCLKKLIEDLELQKTINTRLANTLHKSTEYKEELIRQNNKLQNKLDDVNKQLTEYKKKLARFRPI